MPTSTRYQSLIFRLEQLLDSHLPPATAVPLRLHQAMRYSALNAGKRMRPVLAYLTGTTLGLPLEVMDRPAMSLELIHAYSLIHDDLPAMDNDELRRGLPTCHIQFDEATAILAGDALQTEAFQALAGQPSELSSPATTLQLIQILSAASGSLGMGGGQATDLESTGSSLAIEELQSMHQMKTGALIKASVQMACCCAQLSSETEQKAFDTYASSIGLAFQIKDDILDVEGDTATIGKPAGSDTDNGKNTYPALLGMDGAKHRAAELLQISLDALSGLPYNVEALADFARVIVQRDR